MKLDIGSIAFNLNIADGAGTPSWGTALGQNTDYKFTVSNVEDLITSMVYCKIDENLVYCPLGKGGHSSKYKYELAGLYKKIYVNNMLVPDAQFVLLMVKEVEGDFHVGRKTIKYSPKITYQDKEINQDCFNKIISKLGLNENSAWFVYSIYTKNQDELHFDVIIANQSSSLVFNTTEERKNYMLELLKKKGINIMEEVTDLVSDKTKEETDTFLISDVGRVLNGFNKIYYGVPGSGKSFIVSKKFDKDEYKTYRTTFHPEYTNSDFVGQIIPCVKENKVEYTFHPGPFTLALKYALKNKNEKVCLVIEEINRGNSSAIFGDIFQLLDRDETGKSKYEIYNGPILDYFSGEGIRLDSIFIPSNMWIIATMNTSDQNVFTLDTAFKRRWKMEYIKNVFADNEESKKLKNKLIPSGDKYPNITWEKFVKKINKHIINDNSGINAEDKQLGMYFVSIEELNNKKEFAEKILSYIWEDVAKLNTTYWFGTISSYDELLNDFEKNGLDVFNNLFEEEIIINDEYTIKTIGE